VERPRFVDRAWRIAPARALVVVVGLYVAYLVVMNVLLATGAFRGVLNRLSPEHVRFEWSSGYSPYPFCFHLNDFVLTGQDRKAQWRISFDETTTTIDPHALFAKRIRMQGSSSRGVVVWVRTTLEPPSATPAKIALRPPIPGVAPPVRTPPTPSKPEKKWGVELVDASVTDVREVWVNDVRIDDVGGVAHGGFVLEPTKRFSLERCTYLAREATVAFRGRPVATSITGAFATELHDHHFHSGSALRELDLSARARATTGDLHVVVPEISGGAGLVLVDAKMIRGRIQDGSQIDARSDAWRLTSRRDAIGASSRLRAGVEGGVLRAKVDSLGALLARDGRVVARAETVGVALELRDLDLSRPLERWGARLDVPAAKIAHLETLDGYFGKRILKEGSATFSLHANLEPHLASDVRFELRDVAMAGVRGWWSQASARQLVFAQGRFGGTFAGRMRDPTVPLAVLGVPKLARKLVPGGKYTFQSTIHAGRERFALTNGHAEGHALEVLVHYHHDRESSRGAALVELGRLTVGVQLHDGDTDVIPLASRGWYERQP
jgi:hypothetical protein